MISLAGLAPDGRGDRPAPRHARGVLIQQRDLQLAPCTMNPRPNSSGWDPKPALDLSVGEMCQNMQLVAQPKIAWHLGQRRPDVVDVKVLPQGRRLRVHLALGRQLVDIFVGVKPKDSGACTIQEEVAHDHHQPRQDPFWRHLARQVPQATLEGVLDQVPGSVGVAREVQGPPKQHGQTVAGNFFEIDGVHVRREERARRAVVDFKAITCAGDGPPGRSGPRSVWSSIARWQY